MFLICLPGRKDEKKPLNTGPTLKGNTCSLPFQKRRFLSVRVDPHRDRGQKTKMTETFPLKVYPFCLHTELKMCVSRALGKRELLMIIRDNFVNSALKHVVTLHLNRLVETVQMRGRNIWFQ